MIRELYDDDVALDLADGGELGDELAVRQALVRIKQTQKDLDDVQRIGRAVAESYAERATRLEAEVASLRAAVLHYLERHGQKLSFPDVGTAYLRKAGPKIRVVDRDAFRAATADVFVKQAWDETWAKQYALERATEDGELLPGVEVVPGGPDLTIRG